MRRILVQAFACGAVAGAATGIIDGLWSWGAMSQFVDAGGKLGALVFLAAAYGLLAAILVPAFALVWVGLYRGTHLGAALRGLAAARRRHPDSAAPLALAVAAVPSLGACLWVTFVLGAHALALRKHMGLIIASAMGLGLLALLAAALVTLLLARPIELALAALARRAPPLGRALAAPAAPLVAAALLLFACAAVIAAAAWDTLRLLHLRPLLVIGVAVALSFGAWRAVAGVPGWLARRPRPLRAGALTFAALFLFTLIVHCGGAAAPRKAALAQSGLGGPLTLLYRSAADLDRDGYSRILGGGDCDDWDREVHPGAPEIPDDGIDNNCVGGDVSLERDPAAAAFAAPPAALPPDFNVLLVTIDTLRADHLSAYGYRRETSPNLDRLAAEGTLFENAWAHAPSTRYSIPAILTGRYPLDVDYFPISGQWPGIAESNTTIAEILQGRGFATGAVLNYWYFDRLRHMNQGFEHYSNVNKRLHKGIPGQGPAMTRGSSSAQQTDATIALIRDTLGWGRGAGRRFFVWVHYYDPHYDYERHPGFPDFGSGKPDLYDNEIRFTDHHIGRLFDELRRDGAWKKTVVVVTGDHGEGFGEHGVDFHGYHLYGAQTRVPFIVRVPGAPVHEVATPVGHVDILPTLANLAGAEPTADMDGRSLVPLLAGAADADADRTIFQELSYENHHEMRAAASRRCHVIFNVSPHLSWETYRIDRDPQERRDVTGDPVCAPVRKQLEAFYDRSEIPRDAASALLDAPPPIAHPLGVHFGGEAELLAVDLPEAPVARGDRFTVTYTFAARGRIDGNWKVFVHFDGPQGSFFQGDHRPARPTSWWRAGQTIRYRREVTVPRRARPGRHQVWIGMFRGKDRYPLSAKGRRVSQNRALVGEIDVK